MKLEEFAVSIKNVLPVDYEFDNPGGGTTKIIGYNEGKVLYKRGDSKIYVKFSDLLDAYERFSGSIVKSTDLKEFRPSVFDPKARPAGHSCNCTFLFVVLGSLGLAGPIMGGGVRGNPFYAEFK